MVVCHFLQGMILAFILSYPQPPHLKVWSNANLTVMRIKCRNPLKCSVSSQPRGLVLENTLISRGSSEAPPWDFCLGLQIESVACIFAISTRVHINTMTSLDFIWQEHQKKV